MGAHGSENVIRALEKLLATAKQGKHGYLVGLMVGLDQQPYGFWGGSIPLEAMAAFQLRDLSTMLDGIAANKSPPPRDENVPYDRVFYNMPVSPMSFDFTNWLIDAEMTRRIAGAPSPLKVAFWAGRDGKTTGLEQDPYRAKMFEHVVKPLLGLIGAVEDETAVDGHCKMFFSSRDIIARFNEGHEVPKFNAPPDKLKAMKARFPRAPVTLTLRESQTFPFRNSNHEAWLKFGHYLKAKGETVVFVRDTAKAMEGVDDFQICPEASLDLHWRMALYETAKMNIFVANGPASLGLFSDCPWLMFLKPEDDDYEYPPNTPKFWREQIGVEMGSGQFPWCRHDQQVVWQPDTYENLKQAWHAVQDKQVLKTA